MRESAELLAVCRACPSDKYGGDESLDSKANTLWCRAKGETATCSACRVLLIGETKSTTCPKGHWGEYPDDPPLEQVVLTVNGKVCVHYRGVPGKKWGECAIGVHKNMPIATCLKCKQRKVA